MCRVYKKGDCTCEELEDEENPQHALEGHIPGSATTFVAAFTDIQYVVSPVNPGSPEVDQGEGQDDGRCSRISHGFQVDQQYGTNFAPVPDAVGRQGFHFLQI